MKTEILNIITRLENNIAKLEKEIASGYFQKGYNLNCQQTIESYKQQNNDKCSCNSGRKFKNCCKSAS